jgi:folate-binding protein YgfZ
MPVSTLQDRFTALGTALDQYRGTETPRSFGDPAAEFRALLEGRGLYDMAWQTKLVLTGEDRVRWLNGMVTNNVRDLEPGHGVYSFLLTAQGRIVADLVAYNRGDHLLVTTDRSQAQAVKDTFEHYIIMDDVEVGDISDKLGAIGLAGSTAAQMLNSAGIDASQLVPGQLVDLVWRDIGISVSRGTHPNLEAYEVWFAAEHAETVWNALVESGATPIGSQALEWYRIARGVPRYGVDLTERDLPQETEQQHALNFAKGCYIGQEIVERIRARAILHRTFTGFLLESDPPQPGTKITEGERNIGEIRSAARIPFPSGERTIALGYLRRESAMPGTVVHLSDRTAIVQSIPFSF